jgi:hypothetical protein
MRKYRPSVLVTAAVLAISVLALYGIKAWYFPSSATWLLIVPLSVIGFALALWTYPRIDHLYSSRALKINARVCTMLLVPLFICTAFGIGVPAISLRVLGPDTQIAATITDKRERFKRCRKRVYLAEHSRSFKGRICVSGREFEKLEEGQRVLLSARVGVFGTFVFSIQPS